MPEVDVRRTTETGPVPQLRPFQSLADLAPEPVHEARPLISGPLAAVLATLAAVGAFTAGILPAPGSWILAALACVLALVAGVTGFRVPDFAVGRPLVKASLVAPLTTIAGFVVDYAFTLPEGYVKGGLTVLAIVCVGLAGVPLPRPRGGQ